MKKILILTLLCIEWTAAMPSDKDIKIVSIDNSIHNLDTVSIKEKILRHRFIITNISNEDVSISNVRTYCGCTHAEWTRKPVMPGDTCSVTLFYENLKSGRFSAKAKIFIKSTSKNTKEEIKIIGVSKKK